MQLYSEILDVDLLGRPGDITKENYPKIAAWMEACSEAPGLKEVHSTWKEGPPKLIGGMMAEWIGKNPGVWN